MKKKLQRVTSLSLALALVAALFVSTTIPASASSYSGSASYKSGKYYRALTSVQLTGNQRTDIVNVAKSQVGYQEGSSSSQLSGEVRGHANCTEYGRWYGLQDMWCAMFVSWCANAAGISTSTVPKHCFTPSGLSWFQSRGLAYSRATVAAGGYKPQPGDIIYFKSPRNSNTTNHIGIVTSYSGSTVYTIEGNTSSATVSTNGGAVAAKSYSISNTYIVYICRPNYTGTNISTGTDIETNPTAKALTFDANYYANKYADLKSAYGTNEAKLYEHFRNNGIKEGRQASPCFDVKYYLTNNADLKSAFGSNYQKAYDHYITTGYKEYHRVATAAPVNLGNDFKANISFSSKNLSLSGDNVILYTPSSAPAQIWRFIRQSDGSYKIVNTKNNKCLDANGATDNAGANVSLYNDNGSRAQRWFIYSKNGKYILRPGCARLTVLDVNGGSTNNLTNIQQYTYNDSNAQMFSITKVVAETAAPTISNVKVSDVTAAGYKVTCTVNAEAGIKEVKFPTWTSNNGQDDIKWHVATISGNTASYYVNVKDHKNESGKYETHIYVYDKAGKEAKATTSATVPAAAKPTISNVKVSDVTAAGYKVTCTVSSPIGIKEVKFPTWTSNNGQDDIKWHVATISGNTASYYVNVKDHNKESGKYITHIYAYDNAGKYAVDQTAVANVPANALSQMTAVNLGDDFCARISFATANKNLSLNGVNVITFSPSKKTDQVWRFKRNTDNSYTIINEKTGNCLDVLNAASTAGTNVATYKSNNSSAQRWYLYLVDGKYVFRPACSKECVLDVATGSTADGANIQIYTYIASNAQKFAINKIGSYISEVEPENLGDDFCARISFATANKNLSLNGVNVITFSPSKKPDQVWRFKRNTDNSYTIINEKTGNCLDVSGAASTAGTNVATYKSNNSSAQRWYLYLVDGKYVFRPACSKECVLDVATGSTADGANIQIYTYIASNAQKFAINKIGSYISEVEPENLGNISTCITFPKANKNLSISGSNVILYTKSTSDAQVWNFTRQSDGSYKIVNKKYNKCLDVDGAKDANAANVALYTDNGSSAQRWFVYLKEGKYILRPACSSTRVLDVYNGGTADSTNICICTYGGVNNEFTFTAPSSSSGSTSGTATASQMAVMRKIIYAVETGGQVYGNVRYDDFTEAYTNSSAEHAITIGGGAWYANEAKRLLNRIRSTDPATFKSLDTAGIGTDLDTADWSTYKLSKTSAKAKCIQKIIGSPVGIKCQDQLLDEQMAAYMQEAKNLGVTDIAAQMMCANFRHQGGLSAMKRIINKTATPYTLDNLYAACQTDTGNQVGAYKSRQKMVYNALKTYL